MKATRRSLCHRLTLVGLLCLSLSPPLLAKQLSFHREANSLSYRWLPPKQVADGAPQSLTLTLSAKSNIRFFSAWRPEAVKRTLYTRILAAARQTWPDVIFELHQQPEWRLDYRHVEPSQLAELAQWLQEEEKTEFQTLLQENYLQQARDPLGVSGIKPDHTRIIAESGAELGDAAEALLQAAGGDEIAPRQLLTYLLAFVQSIPYDKLQSQDGSRGTGYLLPRQVLSENRGDCDSKVALLATLLQYLRPEINQALIFIPNPALLGVAIPAQAGEESLSIGGESLLLLEPTGPAELPPGQLGPESQLYIHAGSYVAESLASDTNSTPSR